MECHSVRVSPYFNSNQIITFKFLKDLTELEISEKCLLQKGIGFLSIVITTTRIKEVILISPSGADTNSHALRTTRRAPISMKLGQNSVWCLIRSSPVSLKQVPAPNTCTRFGFFELTSEPYVIERFVTTIIDAEFYAEKDGFIHFVLGHTKHYSDQVSSKSVLFSLIDVWIDLSHAILFQHNLLRFYSLESALFYPTVLPDKKFRVTVHCPGEHQDRSKRMHVQN
eukprot:sb/3469626/